MGSWGIIFTCALHLQLSLELKRSAVQWNIFKGLWEKRHTICMPRHLTRQQRSSFIISAPINPVLSMTSDSWNSSPPFSSSTLLPCLLFRPGHPACPLHLSFCWVWKTNRTEAFVSQCRREEGWNVGVSAKVRLGLLRIPFALSRTAPLCLSLSFFFFFTKLWNVERWLLMFIYSARKEQQCYDDSVYSKREKNKKICVSGYDWTLQLLLWPICAICKTHKDPARMTHFTTDTFQKQTHSISPCPLIL